MWNPTASPASPRRAAALRDRFAKIGAKIVRHGRSIIHRMAEVAIARRLCGDILAPIAPFARAAGIGTRSPKQGAGRPAKNLRRAQRAIPVFSGLGATGIGRLYALRPPAAQASFRAGLRLRMRSE
jgi:hypothetical protein